MAVWFRLNGYRLCIAGFLLLMTFGISGCSRSIDPGANGSLPVEPSVKPVQGMIQLRYLQDDPNQPYYLYVPASAKQGSPLFVTLHAMNEAANKKALTNRVQFKLLPGSAHHSTQCMERGAMGSLVFPFLFHKEVPNVVINKGEVQ